MVVPAIEWYGIMRHAQAYRPHLGPEEACRRAGGLSRTGAREAAAVADRVAETVLARTEGFEDWTIEEIVLLYAPTAPARETAAYVEKAINQRWTEMTKGDGERDVASAGVTTVRAREERRLDPEAPTISGKVKPAWCDLLDGEDGPKRMVLLIGHDPQTTLELHSALAIGRTRLTRRLAQRTSLERGEMAMVRHRGGWTELMWVVSPDATKAIDELQTKIRSKMETAKVLGAFLTALIFFAAKDLASDRSGLSWYPWVAGAGITLLSFATVAFIVTMFVYDGLLMPVRYWAPMLANESWLAKRRWYRHVGTGQDPRRPPSSAASVLYHGMQRTWSALFVPAVLATGLGTAAIATAYAQPSGGWWIATIGALVGVVVIVSFLALVGRPQLGTTD